MNTNETEKAFLKLQKKWVNYEYSDVDSMVNEYEKFIETLLTANEEMEVELKNLKDKLPANSNFLSKFFKKGAMS